MRRTFKAPVIVKSAQTLVDGGVKLHITTRELAPEEMSLMFALRGTEAWMLLAPNELEDTEVPEEPAKVEANEKTPGQRLRAVLYKTWEQTNQGMQFELYYRMKMESIIDRFKQELDN